MRDTSVENFSARCRRYMMVYFNLKREANELTFNEIERFIKISKTHRNIGDQEKGFIQKVILESILLRCNEMLSSMTVWTKRYFHDTKCLSD